MALLFMDGFDHYTTADTTKKWNYQDSVTATLDILSTSGRRGSGALYTKASSGGAADAYLGKSLSSSTTFFIGFAIKVDALPSENSMIARLQQGGTTQTSLYITPDLKLFIANVITTSTALSLNTWAYIEWKSTIMNAVTSGTNIIRINGVIAANGTSGDTQATGTASADRFDLGALTGGSYNHGLYFDDLYICNTAGTTNNDFLGDTRVDTLLPNADGTYTQWTPSTGTSHYALVDEATPNTSDYNASPTAGNRDSYNFQNLAALGSQTIYGVQVSSALLKGDSGGRQANNFCRSGTTDLDKTGVALSTSQLYISDIFETDPATTAAWTEAGVNAAEFGVKVTV